MDAREGRHPLAAALHERRPARRGRTARPTRGPGHGRPSRRLELRAPGLQRAVERGRRIRRSATRARPRPGCASPAAPPAAASAGRPGPSPTAAAGGARWRAGRGYRRSGPAAKPLTWSVSRPARRHRSARGSAVSRASGTNTECRSWKPSARRPMTARVRLSLARASRTTGVRWARRPQAIGAVTDRTGGRSGLVRAESAPMGSLAQDEPLAHRQRLRPPVGRDAGARPAPPRRASASTGELARQHVVDHLAPLTERRLDEAPQLVLVVGPTAGRRRRTARRR